MFNCSSRYEPLLQTTNFAPMLCRAAVHSAWIVYIDPPSPLKPTTVLSGLATLTPIAPGNPTPSEPPRVRKYWPVCDGGRYRDTAGELVNASSNTTTSPVSCAESSSMKRDIFRGTASRTARSCSSSAACLAAFSLPACSIRAFAASFFASNGSVSFSASASRASDSFGSATIPRSTGWFFAIS